MLEKLLFGSNFNKNRIQWIDNARGLCMFLVIVVHTGFMPDIYRYFLEPFFLTAFFFISGYLFNNPDRDIAFRSKIASIIDGVLVPYLVYWVLSYTVDHLVKGDLDFSELIIDIAMGNKLWFVAALFISQLMFCVLLKINKRIVVILFFSFMSIFVWYLTPLSEPFEKYPWSVNIALVANFFIGLGYVARLKKDKFLSLLNNKVMGSISSAFFISLVIVNSEFLNYSYNFPANNFGNLFVFIVHAFLGIHFALFIATLIKNNYLLLFVGANSLLFYFFQNQILRVLKKVASMVDVSSPSYLAPLIMAFAAALLLIIPIKLTNRFFPILTGKVKFIGRLKLY